MALPAELNRRVHRAGDPPTGDAESSSGRRGRGRGRPDHLLLRRREIDQATRGDPDALEDAAIDRKPDTHEYFAHDANVGRIRDVGLDEDSQPRLENAQGTPEAVAPFDFSRRADPDPAIRALHRFKRIRVVDQALEIPGERKEPEHQGPGIRPQKEVATSDE